MTLDPELISRVVRSTGLTPAEAARVVTDVVDFYAEPVEDFVRRRHAWWQRQGLRNPEIFARIGDELSARVVSPPPMTERQLRRVVYG